MSNVFYDEHNLTEGAILDHARPLSEMVKTWNQQLIWNYGISQECINMGVYLD